MLIFNFLSKKEMKKIEITISQVLFKTFWLRHLIKQEYN